MNEQEFKEVSERTLHAIERALENCDADLDFEWQGDGILEICFEDRSKVIVNRHSAAQEIWVAARSGGFHFKREGGQWLDTRDNQPLAEKLSALISQQSGEEITLSF
jgi:CyaY protein